MQRGQVQISFGEKCREQDQGEAVLQAELWLPERFAAVTLEAGNEIVFLNGVFVDRIKWR